MITIAEQPRNVLDRLLQAAAALCTGGSAISRHWRGAGVVVILVTLAGCTNSKLVIRPLYNKLDDQMRSEFHKLGKFNDEQIAYFEQRVGTFHVWHRQSELPRYAALLDDIRATLAAEKPIGNDTVGNWIDIAETYSRHVRECHPVNYSYGLMQTLTDEQVNFIEKRFASERRENFQRYLSRKPEERRQLRKKNIIKWAGRLGFEFNDKQTQLLEDTLRQQISMRRQYYREADVWNRDLFKLARNQANPDYEKNMAAHMQKLWRLLENAYPDEWNSNRQLWREFGNKFLRSMTTDQRTIASAWLGKMSKTLLSISRDEPSFKVTNNAEHGCLVNNADG